MTTSKRAIAIITSINEDWGGSEELWGRSVPLLITKGFGIHVYKPTINRDHPAFKNLMKQGVKLHEFYTAESFLKRQTKRIVRKTKQLIQGGYLQNFAFNDGTDNLYKQLQKEKPQAVIISQGINFDGLGYAHVCLRLGIPYVIVAQKAVDFYWPLPEDRPLMTQVLQHAKACFFVSRHNLRLTEEQFGIRLTNAHVIFNPVKISNIIPYPSSKDGFKLACVGRLFILDKGQDILLRILSKPVWKQRPITVSFVGKGIDEQGLTDMARLLNIGSARFVGHVDDMETLWRTHHALVLPSRSEGLPLSMVEAMAAGRPVIVSKAGGNTELLSENQTGFSGEANEADFEDAMERAWAQREHWATIGLSAAHHIRTRVPNLPETEFVAALDRHILSL